MQYNQISIMTTIGIFDTGFGGRYVAEQLRIKRPHDAYLVVEDHKHLPYGSRTPEDIFVMKLPELPLGVSTAPNLQ
jgi:glutamate racemase